MEKLIVLGTGNASVTKCYNTCSIIQDEKGKYFMIDAGYSSECDGKRCAG